MKVLKRPEEKIAHIECTQDELGNLFYAINGIYPFQYAEFIAKSLETPIGRG